ncbi:PEP-CTERM sorting domain-containing protein [Elioraea sp.]|uniref:PEP-CTERM sorting domain-containing protein n=1 Tax=Elioraea sp. TaxID=2185103 RepID=UPI0025C5F943|nr:PEP-CTERM sorting domain-containing protein [Elioraea sp.]
MTTLRVLALAGVAFAGTAGMARAAYWNVFNVEGEAAIPANIVTYATLADMLGDTNRTGLNAPNNFGFARNIVGSGSDGVTFWNVFNVEGEAAIPANIVTYATRADMLGDTNRTGLHAPNSFGFARNIIGSGSDGLAYWNVFNVEGEAAIPANIVTYATLADMLGDTNRTGLHAPNNFGFARNIVGSGSDGETYWNVFNVEEEAAIPANIVTYATLADMLGDTNRTGLHAPNNFGFARNIVGSGADILPRPPVSVAEPGTLALLGVGLAALGFARRRRES